MEFSSFLTYTVALAIAAVIPGPGVIALVARALGSGFGPTFPMLLGIATGDALYLAATILGLAWLATEFSTILIVLKYVGAAYLIYMAWGFWQAGITADTIKSKSAQGAFQSYMAGLLVTLGNPKAIIFYLALLPNLLNLSAITAPDFVILVVLTFGVLIVTISPYILMAGKARLLLQTPRALKTMNRFAATCLAGAALAIASRSN
ncbi:MAG: LysE family translocator [Ahrensia sp.]|nr:LysE family translocator [Ahrensia sp.]